MPPIQLLLTRRLLLAKQLLTDTTLPITEIAFASGFSSLRRFNDAFNTPLWSAADASSQASDGRRRRESPRVRRRRCSSRIVRRMTGPACSRFSSARALTGIEQVTDRSYARTVQLGHAKGWNQDHTVEEETRAAGRVHATTADAGAAGAAGSHSRVVRSQRAPPI